MHFPFSNFYSTWWNIKLTKASNFYKLPIFFLADGTFFWEHKRAFLCFTINISRGSWEQFYVEPKQVGADHKGVSILNSFVFVFVCFCFLYLYISTFCICMFLLFVFVFLYLISSTGGWFDGAKLVLGNLSNWSWP